MAETCEYVGGLIKGSPGDEVKVDVQGGTLRIHKGGLFGNWDVALPVHTIRGVTFDTAQTYPGGGL